MLCNMTDNVARGQRVQSHCSHCLTCDLGHASEALLCSSSKAMLLSNARYVSTVWRDCEVGP